MTTKENESKCGLCHSSLTPYFQKKGVDEKLYTIHRCQGCGSWQVHPLLNEKELQELYQGSYFEQRTERGYANYLSSEVRKSVESTFKKNLIDLGFFEYEKTLEEKRALEVGCAAGFFVEYLQSLNWHSEGIDIAADMIDAGRKRGLKLRCADFLKEPYENKFQLISFWATLEHLPDPAAFLKRMREHLAPGGRIFLSTCHLGFFARIYGSSWRYMNVPEHLYFFTLNGLNKLAEHAGLKITRSFTYGSGFTAKEGGSYFYKIQKTLADSLAKHLHQGDMIVCQLEAL